jgi:DNA-binding GntR family transcriptional regulator
MLRGDATRAAAAMRAHILESRANVIAVKDLLAAVYLGQPGREGV